MFLRYLTSLLLIGKRQITRLMIMAQTVSSVLLLLVGIVAKAAGFLWPPLNGKRFLGKYMGLLWRLASLLLVRRVVDMMWLFLVLNVRIRQRPSGGFGLSVLNIVSGLLFQLSRKRRLLILSREGSSADRFLNSWRAIILECGAPGPILCTRRPNTKVFVRLIAAILELRLLHQFALVWQLGWFNSRMTASFFRFGLPS